MTDVLVRPGSVHGQSTSQYAMALGNRLDDVEVAAPKTAAAERAVLEEAPVITGLALDEAELQRAAALEYFAGVSAGTEHLPVAAFRDRGVAVTNASGVHSPNVAEHAIGCLLAFGRGLFRARDQQDRREWRSFHVTDLAGSTVAVVGLGAIGQAIVERLEPFDVDTVGVRHTPEKGGPTAAVYGFDDIETAVADADAVVIACQLSDATRGLIDEAAFRAMSTEALLVNVARGPVVVTDALVSAIQRNRIGGAALDVTDPEPLPLDHELWSFENVLITPHVAGNTPAYFDRLADIVAPNVRTVLEGGDRDTLANRVV
jgi:phosphoglycerate dehydrogenase-like enzyme